MFSSPTSLRRAVPAGVLLTALGIAGAAGCGTKDEPAATPTRSHAAKATVPLTVTDPWVKAVDGGMTAAFGTLVNAADTPVNVVSATSDAAKTVELHEVVGSGGNAAMRPKAGGFMIPAKGTYTLQPGADHIMLMGVSHEIRPGTQVTVTLTLKDGRTVRFTAIAKEFAGGKEHYQPGKGGMHGMPKG